MNSLPLKQPQLYLDYLVPAGREKFRLAEVAQILSPDDGTPPVTVQSLRNAMQAGGIFGNRIPFSAAPGKEERIRHEFMTRGDVLQALLVTRTADCAAQLGQLLEITLRLPAEAQDELLRALSAQRARRGLGR